MATMPPLPGSWDTLEENHPVLASPLPGSVPISVYAYPAAFEFLPDDDITTTHIEFVSAVRISANMIHEAMNHVFPMFLDGGEELATYIMWEKQEFDISIPEQFCFFGHCWAPPWAGSQLLVVYHYRLWFASRVIPVGSLVARPILGFVAIIAIGIAISTVLATLMGGLATIYAFFTGRVKVPEIRSAIGDIIKAPGENVKAGLSPLMWAGLGTGVVLIGIGIALPHLTTSLAVKAPVGPVTVTASGTQKAR